MADSIALIDYGAGNLHSVANALAASGADNVVITAHPDAVMRASSIVLPGVGAFGACASGLAALDGMVEALEQRVRRDGVPFLGICVGMQLMADAGVEHGAHKGLGWIAGTVEEILPGEGVKVPHMGWNDVQPVAAGLIKPGEAYFLHGYHFHPLHAEDIAATTDHGGSLVAAVARDNMIGVQFHPEKSQKYGLAFLQRFREWTP